MFLDFSKFNKIKLENEIKKAIDNYKKNYIKYFNRNKYLNKNAKMHDPNPKLIIVKGMGLFSIGNNFKDAQISMDVGINSLSVIKDSFIY